jgi:hypothetical protein
MMIKRGVEMYSFISRRDALKGFLVLGTVSVAEAPEARADVAPHLSLTAPAAAAL